MAEIIAGITVTSEKTEVVILKYDAGDFELVSSKKISLQKGGIPEAYRVLAQQLDALLRTTKANCVCIKATEAGRAVRKSHLDSAETRGVIIAAAAAVTEVKLVKKSSVSKTFGNRKVDEYLKDKQFWDDAGLETLPIGMREAAFTAISVFKGK
jgi:hypothetical protein